MRERPAIVGGVPRSGRPIEVPFDAAVTLLGVIDLLAPATDDANLSELAGRVSAKLRCLIAAAADAEDGPGPAPATSTLSA